MQVRLTGRADTPRSFMMAEKVRFNLRGNSTAELDKRPLELRLREEREPFWEWSRAVAGCCWTTPFTPL